MHEYKKISIVEKLIINGNANSASTRDDIIVTSKSLACTKTRNNETKPPKRNERNDRNHRNETTEKTETSKTNWQNHRNKQNPLSLLRANLKQANLSDIQAKRSVPCTQVSLNSTPVSLNIAQVSLFTVSSQ